MNVVVVESPTKARTLEKYLGPGYAVLASYGHVRDLPAKDGSVRPDEDFAMTYEVDARSTKYLKAIARALGKASRLYLATDPDREGEAIAWHVLEALKSHNAVAGKEVHRVAFNEITKSAVTQAIQNPRAIDLDLVNAQQARRALDYLVGFTLSPVLWRKLPGSRSAGRVQSVALRLVCEREAEIEAFRPREYWTVDADLATGRGERLTARLTHLAGRKLEKFDLGDATAAEAAAAVLKRDGFAVAKVERKDVQRHPPPPFTTSTLQQEASRKLGFGARRTMQVAQQLYEGVDLDGERVGLITYMRTDSVVLAREAVAETREVIAKDFGATYRPAEPRLWRSTAKNAQEAHEAIRPTSLARRAARLSRALDNDQARLYELIWKRTMASQMSSAVLDRMTVDIDAGAGAAGLRATGQRVAFDGFLALYEEGRDDPEGDENGRMLPAVAEADALTLDAIRPERHMTEPPPRYTEASLVRRLEELGIGRPSTYANILSVLQDRDYVRLERKRFVPEDRGRLVTAFLESFFRRYVEYGFTAELENQLDEVSNGRVDWKEVLRAFWREFNGAVAETKELRVKDVLEALDTLLGPHFFRGDDPAVDPRRCPGCGDGRLSLKLGKFGAFIGCSNYPACRFTRRLVVADASGNGQADEGPRELGNDPATGLPVSVRQGPYGAYAQLGAAAEGAKPKRVSLPRGTTMDAVDLDRALALLALPRDVGRHPESGETISAGIGRFGPYLRLGDRYVGLPADEDVLTIGLNRAIDVIANAKPRRARGELLAELGAHPDDGEPVTIKSGRYGPYIEHRRSFASVPKGREPGTVTLDEAVALLAARKAAGPGRGRGTARGAKPKKTATPKPKKKAATKPGTGPKRSRAG
ncbi:MAG: type I DNA topoisomerase [Alphaproteobacteria bacterium]